MFAYYAWYAGKIMLNFGGPQIRVRLHDGWDAWREDMRIHSVVLDYIVQDFIAWSVAALILGFIIGFFIQKWRQMGEQIQWLDAPSSNPEAR